MSKSVEARPVPTEESVTVTGNTGGSARDVTSIGIQHIHQHTNIYQQVTVTGNTGGSARDVTSIGTQHIHQHTNIYQQETLEILKDKSSLFIKEQIKNRVEVSAVNKLKSILLQNRFVTIVGFSGEGKTTLGCFVLKAMESPEQDVFLLDKPSDYDTVLSKNTDSVMMFIDVVGTFTFDPIAFSRWRKVLTRIFNSTDVQKGGHILFSCSQNVFNVLLQHVSRTHRIALFNAKFDYSKNILYSEKEQIFDAHLHQLRIDDITKQQICSKDHPFGFAYSCGTFAKLQNIDRGLDIEKFFENPPFYLEQPTRTLLQGSNEKELLQRLIKGNGEIDLNEVDDDTLRFNLRHAEQNLMGSYLKMKKKRFTTFSHPLMYDCVAFAFGRQDPLFIVRYCSISFIMQRVKINNQGEEETLKDYQYLYLDLCGAIEMDLKKRFATKLREKDFAILEFAACKGEEFIQNVLDEAVEGKDQDNKSDAPPRLQVDDVDAEESTMLLFSAMCGNTAAIKVLLRLGAKADVQSKDLRRTSIHYLSLLPEFDQSIIGELMSHGLNINEVDKEGNTALHYMCKEGKLGHVKNLLDQGIDVNIQNSLGETALHTLCAVDTKEIDIDVSLNIIKDTVRLLIEHKADVATPDNGGAFPLHSLCKSGIMDPDLIDSLMTIECDKKGRTPLHYLCQREDANLKMVKKLVSVGIDINVQDDDGKSALHFACMKKRHDVQLLTSLTENSANITLPDKLGKVPFHYLCEKHPKTEVSVIHFMTKHVDTVQVYNPRKEQSNILTGNQKDVVIDLISRDLSTQIKVHGETNVMFLMIWTQ